MLSNLFKPKPNWYTSIFQTGFKSPWTNDHIGRFERHDLDSDRKQMRIDGVWLEFKDGDQLDKMWRDSMYLSLLESFGDKFKEEHGNSLNTRKIRK